MIAALPILIHGLSKNCFCFLPWGTQRRIINARVLFCNPPTRRKCYENSCFQRHFIVRYELTWYVILLKFQLNVIYFKHRMILMYLGSPNPLPEWKKPPTGTGTQAHGPAVFYISICTHFSKRNAGISNIWFWRPWAWASNLKFFLNFMGLFTSCPLHCYQFWKWLGVADPSPRASEKIFLLRFFWRRVYM